MPAVTRVLSFIFSISLLTLREDPAHVWPAIATEFPGGLGPTPIPRRWQGNDNAFRLCVLCLNESDFLDRRMVAFPLAIRQRGHDGRRAAQIEGFRQHVYFRNFRLRRSSALRQPLVRQRSRESTADDRAITTARQTR
jgi:hypothetical protein